MDLCYNPSNERLHNAAEPGRVDDGKHARLSNSPFFGHAERTTRTFNPRCFASLRGHLRLQWLHVLFFGIVKPTFSPPAALCALAGRIKEGETVRLWGERRANPKKRARCGHGRAGGAISHMAPHRTQNPNKCTHYLRAISTKIEIISCHRMVHNKNSTDLSSGRRPLSKTDEFLL